MVKFCGTGLLAFVITFLLGGCGGTASQPQAPRSTDQPVIAGAPAGFNADDIAFATDTIALYRQTTELTALVPARSNDPSLGSIAADIEAAQRPNLQTVKAFLVQWNSDSDTGPDPNAGASPTAGVVDDATVSRLNSLSGREFELTWLQAMIEHQQGAAATAEAELAKGTNVDALATARQLITTYQAQIARMQRVLAGS